MKGINPIEAHCEKVVLLVVAAVVLAIVVMQFTVRRTVKVGMDEAEIHEAYGQLTRRADVIRDRLEQGVSEFPEIAADTRGLTQFQEELAGSVSPATRLAGALGREAEELDGDITKGPILADLIFSELKVPTTTKPLADFVLATLDPIEYVHEEDVKALLADPEVPDAVAVSVETTFSGTDLLGALIEPAGEDLQPIPRAWWTDAIQILLVQLERQELNPDGTWTDATIVRQMPGRLSLQAEIDETDDAGTLYELVRYAGEERRRIRRPRFYSTVFGEDWVRPAERPDDAGETPDDQDPAIARSKKKLADLYERIERLDAQIAELGGGGRQNPPGGRPGRPDAGRPGRPRRAPPGREGGGRNLQQERNERRIQGLTTQIEKLEEQAFNLTEELMEAGAKDIPGVEELDDIDPGRQPEPEDIEPPILEDDELRLWAHDVTAQRGSTYRYRVIVHVNNPMYKRDASLKDDQKDLAEEPTVTSEPSEWSDPVDVPAETYFFITSASDGGGLGQLGGPSATATVATFRWGYWRTGTVRLEPGDIVAGQVDSPQMDDAFAVRLESVPEEPGQEPAWDRGRPGQAIPPQRWVNPRDRDRGGRPGGFGDPDDEAQPEIEFEKVTVLHDALLLDVSSEVSGDARYAYVRRSNNDIARVSPDGERSKRMYKVIRRSAALGKESLQPKEREEIDDPRGRPGPRDRGVPPPGPGGGGGGGGGGG